MKKKTAMQGTHTQTPFILPTQKNRSNLWKFPFVPRPTIFFSLSLGFYRQFSFVVVVKLNCKKERKNEANICIRFFFALSRAMFLACFYLFWNICTVTQFFQPVQIKEVETDTQNTYIFRLFFSMNRNFYLWLMNNNNMPKQKKKKKKT